MFGKFVAAIHDCERGLRDTFVVTAHTMQKNGRDYTVFLITARLLNGNKRDF